jgi:oligopeptide/dipeptide ABC transporter ATP-binding protein
MTSSTQPNAPLYDVPLHILTPAPILSVEDLSLSAGNLRLTENVSFVLHPGEMLGLVGESGCGKSVTALSILRLLPEPPIHISSGRILFDGLDLACASKAAMSQIRGRRIGMIFQEPMTALNPVFTVGDQIAEPLILHLGLGRSQALRRAGELLELVGIASPNEALKRYPHQMSGGQRQRVVIAIAISCEPGLLIADEPTTALDVTVQAQVLALINRLRKDMGLACLLITHDLGVVSQICDRAMVMYAGRIVEQGTIAQVFSQPRHRYTRALLETMPANNPPGMRLPAIPGQVPPPDARGSGCAFAPRCGAVIEPCHNALPLLTFNGDSACACWNPARNLE